MKSLQFENKDSVPILGLGTFRSPQNETYTVVKTAIELGYRHIDCAAVYGNEKEVGQAIADCIQNGTVKREDLWVTSKLWSTAHGKDNVIPALEQTLSDFQLDYVDLYLIHWPVALQPGADFPLTPSSFFSLEERPLESTWQGMIDARKTGLARHIGVSNFSIRNLQKLMTEKDNSPEVNQVELHPYLQQNDLVAFGKEQGILITGYSPLGSGIGTTELLQHPVINSIAGKHSMTPAQVLICWQIERGVIVTPKSVKPERLKQNLGAAQYSLTREDLEEIAALNQDRRILGGGFWEVKNGPIKEEDIWKE